MIEYGILSTSSLSIKTGNFELGWVFQVGNEDIVIVGLRTMLPNDNTRQINLWSNDNVNLANVTVTSIAAEWVEGMLDTPIILSANTSYKVTVFNNQRYESTNPLSFVYNDKITFITGCGGNNQNVAPTFTENKQYPLVDIIIGEPAQDYNLIGSYTTSAIVLNNQCRIRWLENKPINTNITIEYTTGETQGQWQEVSNGEIITSNTNLWIRATLSTEDTSITPILQDLWLEETSAPQDKILITMDWWGRFNNVEDKIKVLYDATKGNLTGAGGAVESFEVEFTPTDLVQTPNPHVVEHLKAYPYEINLDFKEIDRQNRYAEEHLKAYPYEITLDLKHVSEINP